MSRTQLVPSKKRAQAFISSIKAEYDSESIIKDVMDTRSATPNDTLPFVQVGAVYRIGPEILVDSYSQTGTYTSPRIIGIGRNIAIGEEKYLIDTLSNKISNKFIEKSFSPQTITDALMKMDSNFHPNSVFIPLDFYLTLHASTASNFRIVYPQGPKSFLVLGPRRLRVFWSNKYNPFKNLIFIDRQIGQWIVKPAQDGGQHDD